MVRRLRADLDTVGEDVLVGGMTAMNLDVRDASNRDLRVIPAILVVIFLVLALLLRSLVAPALLVAANVVSFAATMGVAALVFNQVLDFPGRTRRPRSTASCSSSPWASTTRSS